MKPVPATDKTIRILFVVTSMGAGGLETYLVNVLSAIDRRKFKVAIVCTNEKENWYKDELDKLGIKIILCPNPYSQIGYVRRIYRIIKDIDFDVVCDFRNDFAAPTMLAAKLAKLKSRVALYRSTRRGFRPDPIRNLYANIMHLCTERWATRIIGNTKAVLDAFYPKRENNEKFAVVCNGVDPNKFSPDISGTSVREEFGITTETIVIGHVGRFHVAKNHPTILKTFAELRREVENVHLLLVGDGDTREKIENLIKKLGIAEHVTLAGQRKDVPKMLSAMDIFFYPSIYEGLPNALIEAMVCGLPIVASNIGEIREITPSDFACQLFETDSVSDFVPALKQLCLNEDKRRELGVRARAWVEKHFSIETSAHNLCEQLTAAIV